MAEPNIPRRRKTRSPGAAPQATTPQSPTVTPLVPCRVLELVRPRPETDTVALLKALLEQAQEGKIVGLVAISMYARRTMPRAYDLSLGGIAYDNKTLALGAVDLCTTILRENALQDAGHPPR